MKLGLISDIHGDPIALELAWSHLTLLGADRIICAGDLVGYGPFPDRVAAFMQKYAIASVRGNHDRWALERGPGAVDEFGGGTPAAETLDYLRTLPFDLLVAQDRTIGLVVHGSPQSDMEFLTRHNYPPNALRWYLRELECNFLAVGHTHRPMWYRCPDGLVLNPGSVVSMPVIDSSRTFALLDLDTLEPTFHDVESGQVIEVEPWEE
jgi:putative phosphoesterase